MIDFILGLIFIAILIYILKVNIAIVPNISKYPFKKKKGYNYYMGEWNSLDYKNFYTFYEIDKEHPNYKNFDFNEFNRLLKSKHRLLLFLFFVQFIIILILLIKD